MKYVILIFSTYFAFSCHASEPSFNASFNCSKARQPIEKSICSNSTLANLDKKMADGYKTRTNSLKGTELSIFKKMHRTWLKDRVYNCDIKTNTYNKDLHIQCLIRKYKSYITELSTPMKDGIDYYLSAIDKESFTLLDKHKWKSLVNWPANCSSERLDTFGDKGLSFFKVDKIHIVLDVVCERYAYQDRHILYSIHFKDDTITAKPLLLTELLSDTGKWIAKQSNEFTGHIMQSKKDGSFFTTRKYSGAGQCGVSAKYKPEFTKDSHLSFKITKAWGDYGCNKFNNEEEWPEIDLSVLQ